MKSFPSWLFLFLLVTACRPESSELDIVRGRPVPRSSPAFFNTVRVEAQFSSCTASIIGERLILTAAHCVEGLAPSQLKVVFERYLAAPEKKIDVSRVQMFKKEGAEFFPQFDIAWLELKESVPAPFKPMEVLRDPSRLTADTPILLAGYGRQRDDCADTTDCSRILKEGDTQFKSYYDEAHIMSLMVFFGDPQKNLSGACFGDSGGPAYAQVQGQWYLIGVTNGYIKTLTPLSDGSCEAGWDVYTFAGDYVPWLESTSGYDLPVADSRLNTQRATPPKIISGLNVPRPSSWSEWVSYANHEDPAWSTMDSILLRLALDHQELDVALEKSTEVLFNPELTRAALARTSFSMSGTFTDLAPLQYFTALQSLSLRTPELTHIGALDALPQLRSLTLQGTHKIADNIMNQVPQLQTRLSSLALDEFSEDALARINWKNLDNLVRLRISGSSLDLSPLSQLNFTARTELHLDRVTIKGSLAPARMPGTLRLSRVKDSDNRSRLGWLGWVDGLNALHLNRMPADSLQRIPDLTHLAHLSLDYMGLLHLDYLKLPPSLTSLSLSGNSLTSLTVPGGWQGLQQISAYDNPLSDTTCPVASCKFDFHPRPQSVLAFCENVARGEFDYSYESVIWSIILAGPKNTDQGWMLTCDGIEELAASLTSIRLNRESVDDIRPLAHLVGLTTLDLSKTEIRDFSPLASLENLKTINLYQILNFDLNVLQNTIGVRASGVMVDDLAQASCTLLAGSCGFIQTSDQKFQSKPGILLGTRKPLSHFTMATALPGLKKPLQNY